MRAYLQFKRWRSNICVIFVADTDRPTSEELEQANKVNGDGIGVAWHDKEKGYVRWTKGLDLKTVQEMAADLPLPYAIHFRLASIGPKVPGLTHPFPVEYKVRLDLMGRTSRGVIMHNGSWFAWDKAVPVGIIKKGVWSDSRAIAWRLARAKTREAFDEQLIKKIPGKFAYVHGTGIATYGEFDLVRPGLSASNLYWKHYRHSYPEYMGGPYYGGHYDDYDPEEGWAAWRARKAAEIAAKAVNADAETKENDPRYHKVDGVWRLKPITSAPETTAGMADLLKARGYVQDARGVWGKPEQSRVGFINGHLKLLPRIPDTEGDVQKARRIGAELARERAQREADLAMAASVADATSSDLPLAADSDATELEAGLSVVERAVQASCCSDCFTPVDDILTDGHDLDCCFFIAPGQEAKDLCNGCGESLAGVIRHKNDCPHIGLGLEDMRRQASAMDQAVPKGVMIDPDTGQVIDGYASWDEERAMLEGSD